MDVELISVGADLFGTEKEDRQLAYAAEKCEQLGMSVTCQMKVNRQNKYLPEMIQAAKERAMVVMLIFSAGIEPKELKTIVTGTNEDLPVKEVALERHGGEETGWLLKQGEKLIALLPGAEIEAVFEKELYYLLQKEQKDIVYFATLKLCGIADAKVREILKSVQEKYPTVKIAVKSEYDDFTIRLSIQAEEEHIAKKALKPVVKVCLEKFGDAVYATDDTVSLEAAVLGLLKERDLTLTTAESLTGGMLASKFTAVPGASEVFKQGFVTYCNRAKKKLLDVKKATLKEYGAVSDRTAKEMAKNGVFATGTDACVSLTGLAGPAAEEGKPVGLVYIACCYKNRTVVRECHFKGNRSQIREQSAKQALILLRDCILADQ